jgi:ABC-type maltose transport system permease subunit
MAVSGDIVFCGYHLKLLLVSLPPLIEGAIEISETGATDLATISQVILPLSHSISTTAEKRPLNIILLLM